MIKFENVSYTYNKGRPDETHALSGIDLEIPDKGVTALIGHTGSGKSTLIQLINGLLVPQSGKIFVNGTEVGAKGTDLRALRFRVGVVFQYPEQQLFEETVRKDIAYGPKNMGLSDDEISRRTKRAADIVGLSDEELDRSPFELSGGQRRRAAIAGVLAMEPEILVMDEPVSGLDPEGRRRIFDLIRRLSTERPDVSVIFVSHSMETAAEEADNIIVMNEGRIAASGSAEEVFSDAEHLRSIGLDIPYVTELCIRLRAAGFDIGNSYRVQDAAEGIKRAFADA